MGADERNSTAKADGNIRSMIERVPANSRTATQLASYGQLSTEGWDVIALLAPDSKTIILLAVQENTAAWDDHAAMGAWRFQQLSLLA